jgi:hypothetical protein
MNIDDIENNLNDFSSEPLKVLNALLNIVAKNQALLEALMDVQLSIMEAISPGYDAESLSKQIADATQEHLVKIQADISSKLL